MRHGAIRLARRLVWCGALLAAAAGCADRGVESPGKGLPPAPWVSRALPEGRGEVKTEPDGKRVAVRYRGWTTADFSQFRTYAYDDVRTAPAPGHVAMPPIAGDPAKGRSLFLSRSLGPCTGCHLVQGLPALVQVRR